MTPPGVLLPIVIRCPGVPVAKGRPRFNPEQRRAYTPKKTEDYERLLAYIARRAMRSRTPYLGPVSVSIVAGMPIPKRFGKVKHADACAGRVWPVSKPDVDNLAKTIDALKGIVWIDDAQVVSLLVTKVYTEHPQLRISIDEAPEVAPTLLEPAPIFSDSVPRVLEAA